MLGAGLAPAGLARFRWAGCWRQGVLVKAVKRAGCGGEVSDDLDF
jgi:hypothetical protein